MPPCWHTMASRCSCLFCDTQDCGKRVLRFRCWISIHRGSLGSTHDHASHVRALKNENTIVVQVTVCESHNIPGGAAHAWVQNGYHFESGPSLYSGMAARCC